MPIDLSKIKKKINPPPDGQDVLRLKTGVVSAISSAGTVTLTLNGTAVTDVPVLSGARVILGGAAQVLSYRGSLLVIGAAGVALSTPVSAVGSTTDAGINSTANANFTNSLSSSGTALHGVAFVAPPSGRVDVAGRAVGRNGTASAYVLLDFEVREGSTVGSGSVFRAASQATAGVFQNSSANQQATLVTGDVVTGLTPGSVYNATLTYAAGSAGQAITYNRRHVRVLPQ